MQDLKKHEIEQVQGGAATAEHAIAGGLVGGLTGSGVAGAALMIGISATGAGAIILGGAALGSLYYMMTK